MLPEVGGNKQDVQLNGLVLEKDSVPSLIWTFIWCFFPKVTECSGMKVFLLTVFLNWSEFKLCRGEGQ